MQPEHSKCNQRKTRLHILFLRHVGQHFLPLQAPWVSLCPHSQLTKRPTKFLQKEDISSPESLSQSDHAHSMSPGTHGICHSFLFSCQLIFPFFQLINASTHHAKISFWPTDSFPLFPETLLFSLMSQSVTSSSLPWIANLGMTSPEQTHNCLDVF